MRRFLASVSFSAIVFTLNTLVIMMFMLNHAKIPLKFCAVGLCLISIGTCFPTALAHPHAGADEIYLLSVKRVTSLYATLWTGAILFAPKRMEDIEIIYSYSIDAVEELDTRNIGNWLWGNLENDRQLVIRRPTSSDVDDSWRIVTESWIRTLPAPSREQVYWTSKVRWKEAIDWAMQKPGSDEHLNAPAGSSSVQ